MEINKEMLIAEFARQIDFANFIESNHTSTFRKEFLEYALQLIQAPTADVVEVVFCEKCKYCKKDNYWKELYCLKMSDDEHTHWVKKDFYCGYGERRAEE